MSYPIIIPPLPPAENVTVILGDGERIFPQNTVIELLDYYPVPMPSGVRQPVPSAMDPNTEVEWQGLVNSTGSDGQVTKTSGGTGWNAKGNFIISTLGDFQIEFKINGSDSFAGLSFIDAGSSYTDINYAFSYSGSTYYLYSSGTFLISFGGWTSGDVQKIAREAGYINFYVNNVLKHSIELISDEDFSSGFMLFDSSIYLNGSSIDEVLLTYI